EERRPPERIRPPEERHERVGGALVMLRRGRADRCRETDRDRRQSEQKRVDGPSVPTARFGRGQDRDVPGAVSWRGCHPGSAYRRIWRQRRAAPGKPDPLFAVRLPG